MFYKIENKELDLLAAYHQKEGPSPFSKIMKSIGITLALFVLLMASYIVIFVMNNQLQSQVDDMKLENEALQLKIDSTDHEPYNQLTQLQSTYDSLERIDRYISQLPKVTRDKINVLQKKLLNGMKMTSIQYNQSNGQIVLGCTSTNVRNIEKYVSSIKEHAYYNQVSYKGYQKNTQTSQVTTGQIDPLTGVEITRENVSVFYSFTVTVTIDGGE